MTDFVALDFETTGLDVRRDRILEVGLVRFSRSGVVAEELESLIDPDCDPGATHVHGISRSMLRGAPSFQDYLGAILDFVDGSILVTHNKRFDLGFLQSELGRIGKVVPKLDALCTMQLIRRVHPESPRGLADACRFLGIPTSATHQALSDARLAAQLASRLIEHVNHRELPAPVDGRSLRGRRAPLRSAAGKPRNVSSKREAQGTMTTVAHPGSGGVSPTARAVENLLAALFEGGSTAAAARSLDALRAAGKSGVGSKEVLKSGRRIVKEMHLSVKKAVTPDPLFLSDIRLELDSGATVNVEVKAQTTGGFGGLASADWVRDETDFLRMLFYTDHSFKRMLPDWMKERLTVTDPKKYFGGWTLKDLWMSDIALLPDAARRAKAGVTTPEDLHDFMANKYLVHVTKEGTQACRLAQVRGVAELWSGAQFQYALFTPPKSSVGIYVGSAPSRGEYDFAYYVAYTTEYRGTPVRGRHKLHSRALPAASLVRASH